MCLKNGFTDTVSMQNPFGIPSSFPIAWIRTIIVLASVLILVEVEKFILRKIWLNLSP